MNAITGCSLPTPDQGGQYVKGWTGYRNACVLEGVRKVFPVGSGSEMRALFTGGGASGGGCAGTDCTQRGTPRCTTGQRYDSAQNKCVPITTTTGSGSTGSTGSTGTTTGSGASGGTGGTPTTGTTTVDVNALLKKYWPVLVLVALYLWAGAE